MASRLQQNLQGIGPTAQPQQLPGMQGMQGPSMMQVPGSRGQQPGMFFQAPRYTPQQQQLQQEAGQLGMQSLRDPYSRFEPVRQRAMSQFQQETIPSILETLAGSGQSGERSSAYGTMLGGAGADLQERLGAQEAQFGQNQQQLGLSMLSPALQEQYDTKFQAPNYQPSTMQAILPSIINAGGNVLGSYFGGQGLQQGLQGILSLLGLGKG